MKLKNPVISIIIIILLVSLLIIFPFVMLSKNTKEVNSIKKIIYDFDIKEYLLNHDVIDDSIKNYNYPKEVFNYININDIKIMKDKIYNRLMENSNSLISKNEIISLISNSVYEFENVTYKDVYDNVYSDIEYISTELENYLNDRLINYQMFLSIVGSNVIFYFLLFVCLLLLTIIVFIEKNSGIIISSIISLLYSLYLYYISDNFYRLFVSSSVSNYVKLLFKNHFLLNDESYIICFILSFVLLLIYIFNCVKSFFKKIKNWR